MIAGLIMSTLMMHIHWLIYASEEKPSEYYKHPVFEPDYYDSYAKYWKIPLWGFINCLFAPLLCFWIAFMIAYGADSLTVYIDSDVYRKKQWWRFWRWGMKRFPKGFSPLRD